MTESEYIAVAKCSVGYHHPTSSTLLVFEWADRPAIRLAMTAEQASVIANGILEQYKTPPPKRDKFS